jgi:hypothetical protein
VKVNVVLASSEIGLRDTTTSVALAILTTVVFASSPVPVTAIPATIPVEEATVIVVLAVEQDPVTPEIVPLKVVASPLTAGERLSVSPT